MFDIHGSYSSFSFSENEISSNCKEEGFEKNDARKLAPIIYSRASTGKASHDTISELVQTIVPQESKKNINLKNPNDENKRDKLFHIRSHHQPPLKKSSSSVQRTHSETCLQNTVSNLNNPEGKVQKMHYKDETKRLEIEQEIVPDITNRKSKKSIFKRKSQQFGRKSEHLLMNQIGNMKNNQKTIENKVERSGSKLEELSEYIFTMEQKLENIADTISRKDKTGLSIQTTSVHPSIQWNSQMKFNLK